MRLFEPRAILYETNDGGNTWQATTKPFVTLVSARAADRAKEDLKRYGYRKVNDGTLFFGAKYVRPLPLWSLFTAYALAGRSFWKAVNWAWVHGWWHLQEENRAFRWRDIRLGPGKEGRPIMKKTLLRFGAYVALAAVVGGLTKAGTMLGLLGLDASTTAMSTAILLAVVEFLRGLERKIG